MHTTSSIRNLELCLAKNIAHMGQLRVETLARGALQWRLQGEMSRLPQPALLFAFKRSEPRALLRQTP